MSDDEIRIAIAESLGWTPFSEHKNPDFWYAPRERSKELCRTHRLPYWTGDLNAMHEVEKEFHRDYEASSAYEHFLRNVVYKTKHSGVGIGFATLNATARQRAEAYLRTKGLWRDHTDTPSPQ